MNGPEHYRRAEQLEQLAVQQWEKDQPLWQLTMQQAQVHATLSLVAATANADHSHDGCAALADPPLEWDNNHKGDGATWKSVLR